MNKNTRVEIEEDDAEALVVSPGADCDRHLAIKLKNTMKALAALKILVQRRSGEEEEEVPAVNQGIKCEH